MRKGSKSGLLNTIWPILGFLIKNSPQNSWTPHFMITKNHKMLGPTVSILWKNCRYTKRKNILQWISTHCYGKLKLYSLWQHLSNCQMHFFKSWQEFDFQWWSYRDEGEIPIIEGPISLATVKWRYNNVVDYRSVHVFTK